MGYDGLSIDIWLTPQFQVWRCGVEKSPAAAVRRCTLLRGCIAASIPNYQMFCDATCNQYPTHRPTPCTRPSSTWPWRARGRAPRRCGSPSRAPLLRAFLRRRRNSTRRCRWAMKAASVVRHVAELKWSMGAVACGGCPRVETTLIESERPWLACTSLALPPAHAAHAFHSRSLHPFACRRRSLSMRPGWGGRWALRQPRRAAPSACCMRSWPKPTPSSRCGRRQLGCLLGCRQALAAADRADA